MKRTIAILASTVVLSVSLYAQQVPDSAFTFAIKHSAYLENSGPRICIDGSHYNLHQLNGGYYPFAKLLREDGYRVEAFPSPSFTLESLEKIEILVIANALHPSNQGRWYVPVYSAFSNNEIEAVRNWVENGGKLFLIADHMPYAGAAAELAGAFGFHFVNGFAFTGPQQWPPSRFLLHDGTLVNCAVTNGIYENERTDSIATFTGSAFTIPEGAQGILKFTTEHYSLQPDTAWQFHDNTLQLQLEGYYQGAISTFGKGKIAVFGEAAMFTAQIVNGHFKAGINSEEAPYNAQFLLNLIHWLDGVENYAGPVKID